MGPTFFIVRHARAVSNEYFECANDGTSPGRTVVPDPKGRNGPHIPGDHCFGATLSRKGWDQCLRLLDSEAGLSPRIEADQVVRIYSSPLERCVQTAILATPLEALRRCGYTIVLVPTIQEAIKYQCDIASDYHHLKAQVDTTWDMYRRCVNEKRPDDYKRLELGSQEIRLELRAMNWPYQPKPVPGDIITETREMLEKRAAGARQWLYGDSKHYDADSQCLVYSHGQIIQWFTQMWGVDPDNLGVVEGTLVSAPTPEDEFKTGFVRADTGENKRLMKDKTAEVQKRNAEIDADYRAWEGDEPKRFSQKRAFIRSKGVAQPWPPMYLARGEKEPPRDLVHQPERTAEKAQQDAARAVLKREMEQGPTEDVKMERFVSCIVNPALLEDQVPSDTWDTLVYPQLTKYGKSTLPEGKDRWPK